MEPALTLGAVALLLYAAGTDVAARRIPNWVSLAIACLGLVRIALALAGESQAPGLQAVADLAVTVVVFAGGAGLFALGWFGGGDVKLLAAGTLWLGAGQAGAFLLATVLAGGILALIFVLRMALGPRAAGSARVSLPYGVAIAAGGILVSAGLI
jgi:prepilin peptidase CpaA